MSDQTARARAEYDPNYLGVRVHVSPFRGAGMNFERPSITTAPEGEIIPDTEPLRLDEDVARAIYEALAEYFGGTGHDTRSLRRDYDDERKRVDRLIGLATERPQIIINGGEVVR